ncbi:class III lanthionine synthetase LanKC [Streptomyces sp. JJ36]|uniref:class III lanthionine synthetase LanKC n=1 Tax=Streptomyces sp. JJ36 TaxID=2736645 RepID=UPI001F00844E|nr:class III lanthionine synthetase LanKC [Streptomyces sp. JJ36]MCF6522296.1 class III lanthionine synthetase LanKC [Streptomyces sp. JJ36]
MSKGYAVFCDADRLFYDAPHRVPAQPDDRSALYGAARREVPEGWQRHRTGDWLALRPAGAELPAQGWKIHVSSCLDNAERILSAVWDYCVPRGVAFKFVPSRRLLHNRNAKYADRGASGKFVTVYPADEEQCRRVAEDLDRLLAGEPGPYILSDLRWGAGPVHLRWGSFTERHCYDDEGRLCPAVEDPRGRLVPDRREPRFQVPEWVALPDFLRPHLEARSATALAEIPYTIESALHFSNGGGVYAARDTRTGEEVVLKEARPYAGLAADGADAVTRLERERTALERLADVPQTPAVRDHFVLGDHHFLALERVRGRPLNAFFARRHPLIEADPAPERLAAHTDWALRVHRMVEEAVAAIHARGLVFNDLHLFNIMVAEDESSVTLLDFEAAAEAADGLRQTVANPGFVAPPDRRGYAVDRYALACLRLALFLPLTNLLAMDREKAAHLAELAAAEFPVPREFLDEAVAEITGAGRDPATAGPVVATHAAGVAEGETPAPAPRAGMRRTARTRVPVRDGGADRDEPAEPGQPPEPGGGYLPVHPGDWPRSRDAMARALLASATPDREDRCFPGDIAQFRTPGGGASFGYGTAGVLHALAETDAPDCPEAEEWLLRHAKRPATGTPLGFYDGLAGVAWTLARLGHATEALELAALVTGEQWQELGGELHGGLAGLGLALDSLAETTGEPGLHEVAGDCCRLVADRAEAGRSTRRAGLLHGRTGEALLFLRRYERTGDTALLDLAATALRADLDRCVRSAGGALQVDEGWRTLPYLGAGSVGIGMVLDDYLLHRDDDGFRAARREIHRAARSRFYAQPGLFRGTAGMVLYLARTADTDTPESTSTPDGGAATGADAVLRRQIGALARTALPYRGHLAFPGEQLMRLSMDLNTGTAGCLLALGGALQPRPASLPFLPPLPRPQSRPSTRAAVTENRFRTREESS